jgi:hypothetical protein
MAIGKLGPVTGAAVAEADDGGPSLARTPAPLTHTIAAAHNSARPDKTL